MAAHVASAEKPPARANRLAREKSPYLLQHQFNPVDWQPWGDEAFAQARGEDKPIFLSVGYSTCHWCHVMERESFENDGVAKFLNEHFVSIKVDREERPDVDRIYMTFVQATTGQGGWPMSVFLAPDLKPFFGGTYFPPDARQGRPGFLQLLQHIHQLWRTRRNDLEKSAADMHQQLAQMADAGERATSELKPEILRHAGELFKSAYDPRYGGFGGAPKFPQPSQPQLLLRFARRFGDEEAVRMVLHTCERMAAGGIHDQLGGGFSRYSVDAQWLVPHFEKMLYDNAQLAQLYLDAYLVSGDAKFASVVQDVLDYVLRDMTHAEGGFFSAEDADSEGHEGKFYCWTQSDLEHLLKPDELNAAVKFFGITSQGNFVDHSHPEPLPNLNVLSVVEPTLLPAEAKALGRAMRKMSAAREQRVRPQRDDKVLASWNGLMLGAMARAGAVLGLESYRAAAERNLAFMRKELWDAATNTLSHRWRDGECDRVEVLEGYSFLLAGVLDAYEVTVVPEHLDFAIALAEQMLAKFYDAEHGGFWQSPANRTDLILRVKEAYDGAEPSGNSVAIFGLLRLGHITGNTRFTKAADKSLRYFAGRLEQLPQAVPFLLQALDFYLSEPSRAVIAGEPSEAQTRNLLQAIHSVYQPNKVVLGNLGAVEPFARTLPAKEEPQVYLCTGTTCQPPTNDPDQVKRLLGAASTQ